jgi:nitrogen regulatory protein PII-like uncharacterized protein
MKNKKSKYIISIIIAVLTYIGFFFLQFSIQEDTVGYIGVSVILFIISLIIGLFIQKIQSREEFQEQLRSKAIGAIRRLSDIEILVKRGLANVLDTDNNSKTMFKIINDSVRSAIYDWTDVLEEDFKKIQEIEDKKLELIDVLSHKNGDNKESRKEFVKIKNEITELQKSIPSPLYNSFTDKHLSELQFFKSQEFLNYFASSGEEFGVLIEVLDSFTINLFLTEHRDLTFFYPSKDEDFGLFITYGLDIDVKIGKVINTFSEYGISDANYYQWLFETLNVDVVDYDGRIKDLDEYSYIEGTSEGDMYIIRIPKSKLFFAVG